MTTPSEKWAERIFKKPTPQAPKPKEASANMSEVLREALRTMREGRAQDVTLFRRPQK